mmetsp:Transcript_21363/g.33210  ORF Transcript_21363/g.33210 Transcript_21363/m.33210 type:complete len:185 (-) Transcript_21363:67-621(-)
MAEKEPRLLPLPENPVSTAFVNAHLFTALDGKYHMAKDSKTAVQHATQIFLMMIASTSSDHAGAKRRHVVQKSDVRESIEKMSLIHLTDFLGNRDEMAQEKSFTLENHTAVRDAMSKSQKRNKSSSNPYCQYIKQEMPKLKDEFPGYKLADLAREAAKKWKVLSVDEKKAYHTLPEIDEASSEI